MKNKNIILSIFVKITDALQKYQGTIITISHDRFFFDKVSTQILSFENNGKILINDGNYSEFHDWKINRQAQKSEIKLSSSTIESEEKTDSLVQKVKNVNNLSKNQLQKIENRIKEIEVEIPQVEEKLAKQSLEMSLPEIASDLEKLTALGEKYKATELKIQSLYNEWEKLAEDLN